MLCRHERGRAAAAALSIALLLAGAGCAKSSTKPAIPSGPQVEIVTPQGNIVVALDQQHAPKSTANFLRYVDARFYDGGTFFRAVPGFVIQGGNKPREKPNDPKLELEPPIKTGLQNKDGTISMARTLDPNSATSEFFIDDGDQPHLDGSMTEPGYAAFGQVVSGMDVVRAISHQPTEAEQLLKPVKIISIKRVTPNSTTGS